MKHHHSSRCTRCDSKFVVTPERPHKPGLCSYCKITIMRSALEYYAISLHGGSFGLTAREALKACGFTQ